MNDGSFIKNIISSNFLFYRIRNYVTIFFKQEVDRKRKETSSCSLFLHYKESSSFCVWYGMVYCLHSEDLVPVSFLEIILKEVNKKNSEVFFLNYILCLLFKTPCWRSFLMHRWKKRKVALATQKFIKL